MPPLCLLPRHACAQVHEETFLNDIFYLAARELAPALFDHLETVLACTPRCAGLESQTKAAQDRIS